MSDTVTVYTISGEEIILDKNDIVSQGGEAIVYKTKKDHLLIKLFTRNNISLINRYKVFYLAHNSRFSNFKDKNGMFSFPLIPLFEKESGNNFTNIIGYVMYRKSGATLQSQLNLSLYKDGRCLTNTKRSDLLNATIKLLTNIQMLHENNILVGDLSLRNILYDVDTNEMSLIDNDSFQFKSLPVPMLDFNEIIALGKGTKYRCSAEVRQELSEQHKLVPFLCEVTTDDFTAPELMGAPLHTQVREVESEYFAIAVLLFKFFMFGKHPLISLNHTDVVTAIRNMEFPYQMNCWDDNTNVPGGKNGPFNILWSHFPKYIKEMFVKAFAPETLNNPKLRPTIQDWISVLNKYHNELLKSPKKDLLYYDKLARKSVPKQDINLPNPSEILDFSSL